MRIDDALPDDMDLPIEDLEELLSWFWPDDSINSLFWIILESYKKGLQTGLREANRGL